MDHEAINFEKDVIERSRQVPVVVDFWAPWCGPCKTLTPILDRLAEEAAGRWVLVKVNTDEEPQLAQRYRVRSIPSVKFFKEGKLADEFVGALPEPEIRRWLKEILPSPHESVLAEARTLLDRGERSEAVALLEPVLEAEPDNDRARVLLAEALLVPNPDRAILVLEPVGFASDFSDKAEALRSLAHLILSADHPEELPDHPVKQRYVEGLQSLKSGDYAAALQAFIDVIQRKRDYAGDGAKNACKAIFQTLGLQHPIADQYYNAFSSALYS